MHSKIEKTPVELINDARQLLALVKERPCINPRGTAISRACAIGYAELSVIEKMLKAAVTMLAEQNATTKAVSLMDEAIERGAMPLHEDDFRRPMGATPKKRGAE